MNEYLNEINKRGITQLCHFTKSSNLPFILGSGKLEKNGILSTTYISQSPYLEQLDKNRWDHHEDYVCCSVQQINKWYFDVRKNSSKDDLFNQWTVIYISPDIIDETSLFSPVNAATARGENLSSGIQAFKNIFANEITFKKGGTIQTKNRQKSRAKNLPTDDQAEILIKDKIPKEKIIKIGFPASNFDVEMRRLSFCFDNLEDLNVKFISINNL